VKERKKERKKEKKQIRRLMKCLRERELSAVGEQKKIGVNLCDLARATLTALKGEVEEMDLETGFGSV
jgi:hypothetical protein